MAPAIAPQPAGSAALVLHPAGLYRLLPSATVIGADVRDSAAVLSAACVHGARQVWIGAALAGKIAGATPGTLAGWLPAALAAGWHLGAQRDGWLEVVRERARLELVTPSWDAQNPFAGATTYAELLYALERFAELLRLRYRWSPAATGLALMRAVHSGAGALKLPDDGEPPAPSREPASWLGPSWLAAGELPAAGYLHAFDLNGMFLAACSSIGLGFGTLHHAGPFRSLRPAAPAIRVEPGYYRASVRPRGRPLGRGALVFDGRRRWYPAPALEWAHELGSVVRIYEWWTYASSHRWLEPWYARLRDARRALADDTTPAGRLALGAVKRVYVAALGRLAGTWLAGEDPTFRPDWRDAVIGRAYANMDRHLARVGAAAGAWPIARDADLVVYHSAISDPIEAAGQLGLELSDQLGKWKPAGTTDAAQAVQAAAEATTQGARLRAVLRVLGAR